ncbi:MAG: sugar ABC transporter permease [Clostridia bacterium]|jgi:multiple sugar transport system permease protein|nr:sugar ABC transporter permease [Clostridia bacterium]
MQLAQTRRTHKRLRNNVSCYLMCGLPVLGFAIFGLAPLLISFYLSFTQLKTLNFVSATFCGLENFKTLFSDRLFGKAILNTLYAMLSVPLSMAVGLMIAQILTQAALKGKRFFRTLFFIPYICSTVAVTLVFKWMFDAQFGVINALFGTNINFLLNRYWFMPVMILLSVWTGTGYYIILFQAALTGVDPALTEAAKIDGAGPVKRFFSIVLPSISATTFYLLVMGVIGGLQTFVWFQIICDPLQAGGRGWGPNNNGITIVYYVYNNAFATNNGAVRGGLASAAAWVLALGILLLTVLNFKLSKYWVHYND